nr:Dabb family protein [uncultured Carboxylicivirga sp.]
MIKHIVLFQLKAFESQDTKDAKLSEIKSELLGLKEKVTVLKSIEVGLNTNPAEQYDIALTTTFDSMEDLEIYAKHPDHLAVGKIIREVLEARACVDYEF